jgi:NAD(P)-dependent dehydrogenase (short-subunit alcohol dehydrogenase family)
VGTVERVRSGSRTSDAALQAYGRIDVLVNNAGVMWVGSFDDEPEEAAHRQLDVNLRTGSSAG